MPFALAVFVNHDGFVVKHAAITCVCWGLEV